ncbi:MAG TPA: glycosyltransferase family 2 protein [Verrucomicrobiae bacterium]|jgi:glycosyltransferase involved in cell wall biosynthesis
MKPDAAILTIAIPTYNRAAKLQAQLERLAPQLTTEVRLCVFDNASPDKTGEVVAQYPAAVYFRAPANGGPGRNIFRCFEEAATDWVWVLSDDDLVTPTAVMDLLAVLRSATVDFVHTYSWTCPYSQAEVVADLPSFLQRSNLSSLWWLTSGIYRMNSFRSRFRLYAEAMSTWGPHLVMTLSLLESGSGKILLSPVRLTLPTTSPISWSTLGFLLRSSLVPEFLSRPEHQQLVADRLILEFFNEFMLMGLRETAGDQQIRKWHRIHFQVKRNLKSYGASGVGAYIFRNWHRPGYRQKSFQMFQQAVQVQLLSWCPTALFHALAGRLPLSKDVRENYYAKRNDYIVPV